MCTKPTIDGTSSVKICIDFSSCVHDITTTDEVYECLSNTDPSPGTSKCTSCKCKDSKATTLLVIPDSDSPLEPPDKVFISYTFGCIHFT